MNILLAEDEKAMSMAISAVLTHSGYTVDTVQNGAEAVEAAAQKPYDCLIFDIMMPIKDGVTALSEIRQSGNETPAIFLTAKSEVDDRIMGLDAGADDYLTKPFAMGELLARIRTSLRHSNRLYTTDSLYIRPYRYEDLVLDFSKRELTLDKQPVHLTPIEYKIVSYLAQNSGKVMTYAAIISNVWGPYADDDNKILRVNMANIRRKIEKNPAEPEYLFTEVGVGYRMAENSEQ